MSETARSRPRIGRNVHISEGAVVTGNVIVGDDVLISPNAVVRCDEPGSEIVIGNGCNIQDNAVLHSLKGCKLMVGAGTSIAHGAIVHGPCEIGKDCFIGFGTVVFRSVLGDGVVVMHRVLLENTQIERDRIVPSGSVLVGPMLRTLEPVDDEHRSFTESVRHVNLAILKDRISSA